VDFGLKNKTALVLAGGGGLGRAIAKCLASEGVNVAIAGLHRASIEATAAELGPTGCRTLTLEWDLADLALIDANVSRIEDALGAVDILVNNTGGPPPTPAAGQPIELWTRQFQSMVVSIIATTDRVLPGMKERRWGRILTSTSSGVIAPIPNLGLSNALRASLVNWSKTLAREVAPFGITANIVAPGRIATNRTQALDKARAERENRSIDEIVKENERAIPVGRYGRTEEYGDVVAFLASPRAAYITGSIVRVDGGLIASS